MDDFITFPSVMAIGWIPFYKSLKRMVKNEFQNYAKEGKRTKAGCGMLFLSGNKKPDGQLIDHPFSFSYYLNNKDFRGALMLHDVRLSLDKSLEKPVKFRSLPAYQHIGYTLYRFPIIPTFLRSEWSFYQEPGVGKHFGPRQVKTKEGAIIHYGVRFRLGRLPRFLGWATTGYWAPYVNMRITYRLRYDGKYLVLFTGSFIPSQLVFEVTSGNIYNEKCHDMERISIPEIKTVTETTKISAEGHHEQWLGDL